MIEYTVITQKGIEYVYAESCVLIPEGYVNPNMAQFYRKQGGRNYPTQCHTSHYVISVTPNTACTGRLAGVGSERTSSAASRQ